MSPRQDDQIFIRDGLKHYRRTYSMTEVRIGLVILGVLAGLAIWIAWKGSQPDPGLFSLDPALLYKGGDNKYENESGQTVAVARPAAGAQSKRGPVPEGLAADGWREQGISSFESENLYVKINGRADFYLALGFEKLYFIALAREDDEATTVDVEMYDMGSVENALGTYAGERQPDADTRLTDTGLGHVSRNAAFWVRGRYYVRAIGSDESQPVLDALAHIETVLDAELPAAPLPWGYAVFAGQMGLDPGIIKFAPANAYSFEFADHVFSALLDEEAGMEIFMKATDSPDAARELATRFGQGFESYGNTRPGADGMTWIEDQYLGNISGARAHRSLVIGVYSAPDVATATAALARLEDTATSLSDELLERAAAANAAPDTTGEGEAEAEADYDESEGESSAEGEGPAGADDEYGEAEGSAGEDEYQTGGPEGEGPAEEEM